MPSNKSLKLYYDFLISLRDTDCKSIIITAGNHDAPSTLEAPKGILNALNIYVVGKADSNPNKIMFYIKESNIVVVAVPFLRDRDIREAIKDESFDDINQRYKNALISYYNKLAIECEKINNNNFFIAMGHLFTTNTTVSDSENSIYIGGLGDISADDFPKIFDYIALGHLHKAQKVGGKEYIRYSGSPIPLSFNETKRDAKVILLEVQNSIKSIKEIVVPKFRDIISIKTNLSSIKDRLNSIKTSSNLTTWIEIILEDNSINFTLNENINSMIRDLDLNLEVLRVSNVSNEFNYMKNIDKNINLSSLTPEDIFKKKCEEEGFDLEENIEIKDIFYEILSSIREEE